MLAAAAVVAVAVGHVGSSRLALPAGVAPHFGGPVHKYTQAWGALWTPLKHHGPLGLCGLAAGQQNLLKHLNP